MTMGRSEDVDDSDLMRMTTAMTEASGGICTCTIRRGYSSERNTRHALASSCAAVTLHVSSHSTTAKISTTRLHLIKSNQPPRRLVVIVRNSGDVSPAAETDTDTSIETPQGPPSLINALNVERALRGIDVDHYPTLGLQRGCSHDQVTVGYESKVKDLLNQGLDEIELTKEIDLLKESYNIFSRSEQPDRYAWPLEVDITQIPNQPPPPQEPEDTGPTRLVGYFMLAWILISFVLSIALNR